MRFLPFQTASLAFSVAALLGCSRPVPREGGTSYDACAFDGETVADAYAWATTATTDCAIVVGGAQQAPQPGLALAAALDTVGFRDQETLLDVAPSLDVAFLRAHRAAHPGWFASTRRGPAWWLALGLTVQAWWDLDVETDPHRAGPEFLRELRDALWAEPLLPPLPPLTAPNARQRAPFLDAESWEHVFTGLAEEIEAADVLAAATLYDDPPKRTEALP